MPATNVCEASRNTSTRRPRSRYSVTKPAVNSLNALTPLARLGLRVDTHAADENGGEKECRRRSAEDDLLAGRREQQASDRVTSEDAAFDGARGDVGGGEPFGVLATEGRSAACAGRTAEYAMATSPART